MENKLNRNNLMYKQATRKRIKHDFQKFKTISFFWKRNL